MSSRILLRRSILGSVLCVACISASAGTPPNDGAASGDLLLAQPKSAYKARRTALMEKIAAAEKKTKGDSQDKDAASKPTKSPNVIVVVVGETTEPEDAKFRQNNWFEYLTGVDSPGASLILNVGAKEETLYVPQRNRMMERWTGPKLGPGPEGVAATGISNVEPSSRFRSDLAKLIDEKKKDEFGGTAGVVYLVQPYASVPVNPNAAVTESIRKSAPSATLKGLTSIVGEMRKIKDEFEIGLLRKAIDITGEAQRGVVRHIGPGVPEYKLEGIILGEFIGGGGMRAGFPSIVGSGPNSTVLHYNSNRRTIEGGDLVVVDIGAEYFYYTADITRTYPASGKFTPRQREIYQLVLDAQEHAEKSFKPGVSTLGSLNAAVVDFFRKSPVRAKDENGREQTMNRFFIHGLGHELGMDVHDVGNMSIPLAPGEVFTIEPGIYISAENLGVRIEDDYLVTKDGKLEKLSRRIPSKPDEIEDAIAKARNVLAVGSR